MELRHSELPCDEAQNMYFGQVKSLEYRSLILAVRVLHRALRCSLALVLCVGPCLMTLLKLKGPALGDFSDVRLEPTPECSTMLSLF